MLSGLVKGNGGPVWEEVELNGTSAVHDCTMALYQN